MEFVISRVVEAPLDIAPPSVAWLEVNSVVFMVVVPLARIAPPFPWLPELLLRVLFINFQVFMVSSPKL